MFKISHAHEISTLTRVPQEVIDVAEGIVTILDKVYGIERDHLDDDGGYVVILAENDDISVLEEIDLNIENLCPEYTESIKTAIGIDYINSMVLCNNEFSIHILMPKNSAPISLLD